MDADSLRDRIAQAKRRAAEEEREAAEKEARIDAAQKHVAAEVSAAKAAFAQGRYAEAEQQFTSALESYLDNRHEIVCNRAACALKLGHHLDAEADAFEALALEPDYVKGHYRLACARQGLGKIDGAIKACRAGLAIQPQSAQLVRLLADCEAAAKAAEPGSAPTEPGGSAVGLPIDLSDEAPSRGAADMLKADAADQARDGGAQQLPTPSMDEQREAAVARKERVATELAKLGWTPARAAAHPGQLAAAILEG